MPNPFEVGSSVDNSDFVNPLYQRQDAYHKMQFDRYDKMSKYNDIIAKTPALIDLGLEPVILPQPPQNPYIKVPGMAIKPPAAGTVVPSGANNNVKLIDPSSTAIVLPLVAIGAFGLLLYFMKK